MHTVQGRTQGGFWLTHPPWAQGGAIGAIAPPKTYTKAIFFTMILYNSQKSIRDIRPFCRPLFCHSSICHSSVKSPPPLNSLPGSASELTSDVDFSITTEGGTFVFWPSHQVPEMSTDQTGSDCIRTEANIGRIRTGSDCNFFENWQIRTGSDWENFCCFMWLFWKYQKFQLCTDFTGLLNQGFFKAF